jgi:hypothetical protein
MKRLCLALLALAFASCTAVSIKAPDGSTMSGSMTNGGMSYSSGPGCTGLQPNPQTQPPVTSQNLTVHRVCDGAGNNCRDALMADAAPVCDTQVAVVKGVDLTTYFGWALAGAAAVAAMVIIGS